MNFKEYLNNIIEERRSQVANLEQAMIESDDKEERAKLGETLKKVKSELDEAEKQLANVEDKEKEQEENNDQENQEEENKAQQRSFFMRGTYGMRGGIAGAGEDMEAREKQMNEEYEKRGKALKEKRSVTVSSSNLLLPKHTGTVLNDTFNQVSTLVDQVAHDDLPGGETYEEVYVKDYGMGGITEEGADYTDAEPVFDYAPINKVKITAYAELTEEAKKLPNIDYAKKVEENCNIALRKKLSQQVIAGTGTKQITGIFTTPKAIDGAKDIEIKAIDENTLDEIIFSYGGDEDVVTEAVLILNKKTLKALSQVRLADGKKAYDIDKNKKTINTIPYVINSNLKDFDTATEGDYVFGYGDLSAYKVATFSPVDIQESADFKFKQGMICYRASVFVGGNVIKQDGFLRVKKKTA